MIGVYVIEVGKNEVLRASSTSTSRTIHCSFQYSITIVVRCIFSIVFSSGIALICISVTVIPFAVFSTANTIYILPVSIAFCGDLIDASCNKFYEIFWNNEFVP